MKPFQQEKKEVFGTRVLLLGGLVFFVATMVAFSFWQFRLSVRNQAVESAQIQLRELTLQSAGIVRDKLSDTLSTVDRFSAMLEEVSFPPSADTKNLLNKYAKQTAFVRMALVSPDGTSYPNQGSSLNLSERSYFKIAMTGKSNLSERLFSMTDGNPVIVAASPLYGQQEVPLGVVYGAFELESLSKLISLSGFSGQGKVLVFQQDGEFILRPYSDTLFSDEANFFDFADELIYDKGYTDAAFHQAIEQGKAGFSSFSVKNNSYYAYFSPVRINNWYTLSLLPKEVITQDVKKVSQSATLLTTEYFLAALVLLSAVAYLGKRSRRKILKISRELSHLANSVPGGVVKMSAGKPYRFNFVSNGFLDLCGYSKEELDELFSNCLPELIDSEDRERVQLELAIQLSTGETMEILYRIRTKKGDRVWVLSRGSLILDEDGLEYFYCVLSDITSQKTAFDDLKVSEERFRVAAEQSAALVFEYTVQTNLLVHFGGFSGILSRSRALQDTPELFARSGFVESSYVKDYLHCFEEVRGGAKEVTCEIRCRFENGDFGWMRMKMSSLFDDFGEPIRVIGVFENITEQKESELRHKQEEQYLSAMLLEAVAFFEISLTHNRVVNVFKHLPAKMDLSIGQSYTQMTHRYAERFVCPKDRIRFLEIFSLENLNSISKKVERELVFEYRWTSEDSGEEIWMSTTMHFIEDKRSGELRAFCYIKNIHERKLKELELQYQAERDLLTGLYNRATTERLIDEYLKSEEGALSQNALLIVDLDNFKTINDNMGHMFGDDVLADIAKKLSQILRSSDISGRVGGDEFIILLKELASKEQAIKKSKELCEMFSSLERSRSGGFVISATVGVAFFPEDGKNFLELYKKADTAMYTAKQQGKNRYMLYDSQMKALGAEEDPS